MNGWAGKILRVDLTQGKFEIIPTSDYVPTYIGGRGVASRIYWEEVPADAGAFDPENRLIFVTGPLQGTMAPTSGRWGNGDQGRLKLVGQGSIYHPGDALGRPW